MEQVSFTDEEVRAEYIRKMGRDLGCLYYDLEAELDWLRQIWSGFKELFGKGPERIQVLNTVASNFFYLVQKLLFESAMLHLSRLTDPPGEGGRKNLTFLLLAESVGDGDLKRKVAGGLKKVKEKCEFARRWRDKRLAHADLKSMRNGRASPLPAVWSKNIDDALESMRAVLKSVEEHYHLTQSASCRDPFGVSSEEAVRVKKASPHLVANGAHPLPPGE
jgi:hypothetical protein